MSFDVAYLLPHLQQRSGEPYVKLKSQEESRLTTCSGEVEAPKSADHMAGFNHNLMGAPLSTRLPLSDSGLPGLWHWTSQTNTPTRNSSVSC